MDTLAYIDLYCERTGPEFWNEPLNAISNVAFVMIAAVCWRKSQMLQQGDVWETLVILLAGAIGVGSFLFHTFAQGWSELADVIPIWSFVAAYVLLAVFRITGHDTVRTLSFAVIAIAVSSSLAWFTTDNIGQQTDRATLPLNGSLQYAPALIALLLFTAVTHKRRHAARHHLVIATLLFCVALLFRTLDLWSCDRTDGIGTHFLWHLFNALMIGVLLNALITKMPPVRTHQQRS